jgi:hypothetical protein
MDLWTRRYEERDAVDEAGGGVAEGFELAQRELTEHASHGDSLSTSTSLQHVGLEEPKLTGVVYGEADGELRGWSGRSPLSTAARLWGLVLVGTPRVPATP